MIVDKKVKLKLIGLDGNAFNLLQAFSKAAKKDRWSEEEINKVLNEATIGDYDHLLCTLQEHCK